MKYPDQKLNPKWITGEETIDDGVIKWAESFGEYLTSERDNLKPLTTSQIRKFFGEVKKIQSDFDRNNNKIPLLKAKLAYSAGRDYDTKRKKYKSKIEKFYKELEKGITAVKGEKENFDRLVSVLESVVAYHKFHGGIES